MGQNPHYFIAIPMNPTVNDWLKDAQQKIKQSNHITYKSWTHPDDLHITLKFFGAVSADKIEILMKELEKLSVPNSFKITIGKLGTFGKVNQPRVLWAGVEKTDVLQQLYNSIETLGKAVGFPKENRPYRPHITIAKKWSGAQITEVDYDKLISSFSDERTITINHFVLYQIHPQRSPKYEVIKKIDLK
ncbi:RNA 2',3'-cyclic phosphodiesterase [Aquibacillus kalidii]|uniref:RNA 2',3'-cyclic phosphodiesterase n=1 Tax=Aquibacillus kalidii TaxID=2762597 RepID=UPI001646CF40|nr:RNA 2',3'-cyclic phosphodiesterase [Aquibacillus kalidii]